MAANTNTQTMQNLEVPSSSVEEEDPSSSSDSEAEVASRDSRPSITQRQSLAPLCFHVSRGGENGPSSSDGAEQARRAAGFITARALMGENLLQKDVFLSPGFRSAASMAGWDDEALLMAALDDDDGLPVPVNRNLGADADSLQAISPVVVLKSRPVDAIGDLRDRKREERTPQHAATPLTAGRRNRRPRRQSIQETSPEALPIGDLSLTEEFCSAQEPALASEALPIATLSLHEEFQPDSRNVPESLPIENIPVLEAISEDFRRDIPQISQVENVTRSENSLRATEALSSLPGSETTSSSAGSIVEAPPSSSAAKEPQPLSGPEAPPPLPVHKGLLPSSAPEAPPPLSVPKGPPPSPASKAPTPSSASKGPKPACLEQLRDELSCAVCLDICFEPSTTSCGHSFCRGCLQSVLQKCGPRCPKCRQHLKGDTWRDCPVNIVLWNTVQLLFPSDLVARKEAAAKAASAKADVDMTEEARSSSSHRRNRGTSEAGTASWQNARPPAAGLRRSSGNSSRSNSYVRYRTAAATSTERREVEESNNDVSAEAIRQRQVIADAAFARQLQMQLLRRRGVTSTSETNGPANLTSAAANLRAVAQRAVRYRTARN